MAGVPHVGINLCFIRPGSITGPGSYASRLLDAMLADTRFTWSIYCHRDLHVPPAWTARSSIRRVLKGDARAARVVFEQLMLPLYARADRIDLLFSPGFVSPLWGAPKLVATIHDMYYRVVPDALPPWQRRYWSVFIPLTARRCHRLIAVSDSTRQDIVRYLPEAAGRTRVTYLACAIDDPDAPGEPVPHLDAGFVLFVANIVASKNPEAVAFAARELAASGRPRQFVHVGEDAQGLLRAAVARHGAADVLRPLGRVSAEALRWLYRHALCMVQPSIYEGFGIPVLEAQQLGAPVICSNAGPLPEVAGDGALYFGPTDFSRLAQLIEELAGNPSLRAGLIAKGRANAARFSWDATARATLDVFRELLY